MDFWHKTSNTNFINFQMINFSTTFCVFTVYIFTLVWMKFSSIHFLWNHINGTLHIELEWGNEFICNRWLNTSSSLVIIWIVLKVYLHFVIYSNDYKIFTYIYINHSISISKWDFFLQSCSLGFELLISSAICTKPF
jgi:hypothetical protein